MKLVMDFIIDCPPTNIKAGYSTICVLEPKNEACEEHYRIEYEGKPILFVTRLEGEWFTIRKEMDNS